MAVVINRISIFNIDNKSTVSATYSEFDDDGKTIKSNDVISVDLTDTELEDAVAFINARIKRQIEEE